ncbi:DNA gyrase inhibitor YacG [Saccharibacter floricola]|uniref:DNA gyrase inhibitor YacG n=1 Tax=Saccharibacter floricola TaxID=231053 RepID=UPI0003A7AA6A|nr:DNA gyrase inhibitor YacG [Saccharibacter floricola]
MSCPICKKPTAQDYRPFCSDHCAQIDLGRWFKGDYRVPSFRQDNDDPSDREELAQAHKAAAHQQNDR